MSMMIAKTNFGDYAVWLNLCKYQHDKTMAIKLNCSEGPFATITVNLNDKALKEDEVYLDTNNCPWVEEFMQENKLGVPTGKHRRSGYCIYPKYKLNLEALSKAIKKI